jgi:hypothetical protein
VTVTLPFCIEQTVDAVRAGTLRAHVAIQRIALPLYFGPAPQNTWRKPVVGPPERPFAEFQVVEGLELQGWVAAWVYRPGKFLAAWEPRRFAELPDPARVLHARLEKATGVRAGGWDVFAWQRDKPLFVELKRTGSSDRIRASQLLWRQAAIAQGVSESAFIIVEWSGGCVR